jgi:pyruvate/2-oxoglutarate/acetoin dehydrogenase E1 component
MKSKEIFYNKAINEAIMEEMERNSNVFIMGEDIATYGGVYKCTQGLLEHFGPERVRDTAISEAAIVGAGVGAAIQGMRPIVEIMYVDFIPISMDAITNQASQIYFISGGTVSVPIVIRTQGGTGAYAGAQHSKCLEAWFTHIPGLKVISPSTPYDAKGLLKAAVRDDNPVVFFEHKLLYGTTGHVPEEEYLIDIGKADIKRTGNDVTIISWSKMVLDSLEAAELLANEGINAEVIDLRSLVPLDEETIFNSIKKTNRVVVVQEAWKNSGFGAEVITRIQEQIFDYLDAPVERISGLDCPIPFSPALENLVIPKAEQIFNRVKAIC